MLLCRRRVTRYLMIGRKLDDEMLVLRIDVGFVMLACWFDWLRRKRNLDDLGHGIYYA
jgi:hypothetical protein